MVTRLKLVLEQPEYSALLKVAVIELRNPSDQARFIVRKELERRGLLSFDECEPGTDEQLQERVTQPASR